MRRLGALGRLSLLPLLLLFVPAERGGAGAEAAAEKRLTWYRMDFPPVYISEGPYQSKEMQGPVDVAIERELAKHGYSVTFRTANQQRILHDLQNAQLACTSILLRSPELESVVEYSIAHSLALPGAVIVRKQDLERFRPFINRAGHIDLEALLREPKLKLGIASGRNYTGVIDQVLARHGGDPHVVNRTGLDIGGGLIRMLLGERIHYTVMFPWEASYLATGLGRKDDIASIPVEGMADYVLAAGACPKTPWGREVVKIANGAIRQVRVTPEYAQIKEYWLDPAARELYRKLAQQYFSQPGN